MTVATVDWKVLSVARLRQDAGQLFGTTPRKQWEHDHCTASSLEASRQGSLKLSLNRAHEVRLIFNVLMVRHEGGVLLVGLGPPSSSLLTVPEQDSNNQLTRELRRIGAIPGEVTTVILPTPCRQFSGGGLKVDPRGQFQPIFSKATHYFSRHHNQLPRWPLDPVLLETLERRRLSSEVEGEEQLLDGRVRITPEEDVVAGHIMVEINTGVETIVYGGLLFPMVQLVNQRAIPAWVRHLEGVYEAKRRWVEHLARRRATVVFPWGTGVKAAFIYQCREGVRIVPRVV